MLVSKNARIHVPTEIDLPESIIVKFVINGKGYKTTPGPRIHLLTDIIA